MMPERYGEMPMDGEARRSAEIESRRTALLESLERRVDGVRELRQTIDSFGPDADPREIKRGFVTIVNGVAERLPAEKLQMIHEASEITRVLNLVSGNESGAGTGPSAERSPKMSEREKEALEGAGKRLQEIVSDPDLVFLNSFTGLTRDLLKKNDAVRALGGDRKKAVEFAVSAMEQPIDAARVRDVRIGAFDVGLVIEPGHYDDVFGEAGDEADVRSEGRHRKGTPVYVVRETESRENMEQTTRHERTHIILEGAGEIRRFPIDRYISSELAVAEAGGDVKAAFFGFPAKARNDLIIDSQHNELLAGLEEAENGDFGLSEPGDLHPYDVFSTASAKWFKTIAVLMSAEGRAELGGDIRGKCAATRSDVHNSVFRLARVISADVSVAKRLGPDALEDVHALFAVLPPSKYPDIRLFLEHRYGKEKVREFWRLHEKERNARLIDSIHGIREKLERDPAAIPPQQIKIAVMSRLRHCLVSRTGISDLPDFVRLAADMDRINELSGDERALDGTISSVWSIFADRKFRESIVDGFRGIPELYDGLPEGQKEPFRKAAERYFKTVFLSDLVDKGIATPETHPNIEELPQWKVIKKIIHAGESGPAK